MKKQNDESIKSGADYVAQDSVFLNIHKRFTLLPGLQNYMESKSAAIPAGLNGMRQIADGKTSGPDGATPLEEIRREAENIAVFIVKDALNECDKRPPNRYCKSMKKTVSELSTRHEALFNSMVKHLNITHGLSAFFTFVNVVDEMFMDGQVSWGRIVAVYAFTAHIAKYCESNNMPYFKDKIALYAGKYTGQKLGHWMLQNGGWESFADQFSDPASSSDSLWMKGLLLTTAALGTTLAVVATSDLE